MRTVISKRAGRSARSSSRFDPARTGREGSTRNTLSSGGRYPMTNVVKKHSISYELAQKMVDEALAKARKLGVTENVAILDDGGNLKAFGRMDGAPILRIEMAQSRSSRCSRL